MSPEWESDPRLSRLRRRISSSAFPAVPDIDAVYRPAREDEL